RAPVSQHIVVLVAWFDRGQPHLCAAFHTRHFYTGFKSRAGGRRPERAQHPIPMSQETPIQRRNAPISSPSPNHYATLLPPLESVAVRLSLRAPIKGNHSLDSGRPGHGSTGA